MSAFVSADDRAAMLRAENDRLRELQIEMRSLHDGQVAGLAQQKQVAEARAAELQARSERLESHCARLEAELAEALNRREQQAEAVRDVKKQVDSRLSKLMEELLRKDEVIHQLEYTLRAREKDKERVQMLERMLSSREENIEKLAEEVHRLQVVVNEAELRCNRAGAQLAAQRERNSQPQASTTGDHHGAEGGAAIVASILPLYRQWVGETEREMAMLEAVCDSLDTELADLRTALESGGRTVLAASHDRLRLQQARKMERERIAKQQQALMDAAAANADSVALNVQAIRAGCDSYKFVFDKVNTTAISMLESLRAVRAYVERQCPAGLPAVLKSASPSTATPPPAWPQHPAVAAAEAQQAAAAAAAQAAHIAQLTTQVQTAEASLASTTAQLRAAHEAQLARDAELLEAKSHVTAAQHQARAATLEAEGLRAELERQRAALQRASEEASSLRAELSKVHETTRRELDIVHAARREDQRKHAEELRHQESEAEARLHEERRTSTATIGDLRQKLDETARHLNEEMAQSERMRAVLEESKTKRIALKHQRDELADETQRLRAALSAQAKDLQHAREVAEAIEVELQHTRAALAFEARTQDERFVGADDAEIFRAWKQQARGTASAGVPAAASAPAVVQRVSSGTPRAPSLRR